jgi:hypothetical protein
MLLKGLWIILSYNRLAKQIKSVAVSSFVVSTNSVVKISFLLHDYTVVA